MKPGTDLGRAGLRLSARCDSLCESVSELVRQVPQPYCGLAQPRRAECWGSGHTTGAKS